MKIAAFMIVRDEETFIEQNIKYHLQLGFDYIFILNHASVDQTAQILNYFSENPKVITIEEFNPSFDHQIIANKLLNFAVKNYHIDWLFPIDADEFLGINIDVHSFVETLEKENIWYANIGWMNALCQITCETGCPLCTELFYIPWPEREWQHKGHFRKAIAKNHENIQVVSGGHYFKSENNLCFWEHTKGRPYEIPLSEAKFFHFELRNNPINLLKKWQKNAAYENESNAKIDSPWLERIKRIRYYVQSYQNDINEIEKMWFREAHTFWGSPIENSRKILDTQLKDWIKKQNVNK